MRRNLLLIVLAFSLVLFSSNLGVAAGVDYSLSPVSLQIHPCIGGGTVEVDIMINTTLPGIVAFVVPLTVSGTSNPVLNTVLTGDVSMANPPGFFAPSLVSGFTQRIINETGSPLLFVAVDFVGGIAAPSTGLYCKMFYDVTGPGTLVFDTMTHVPAGPLSANDAAGPVSVSWPSAAPISFDVARTPEVCPVVNCASDPEWFVGDDVVITINATDAGGTDIQGIFAKPGTPPCGSGVISGSVGSWTYTWDTDACPEGEYTLEFGVYDECCTTQCEVNIKLVATVGFIQIGNTLTDVNGGPVDPCDIVEVPVLLQASTAFGGFNLLIEFDPTLLYFQGIERGAGLPDGWEYFTYRQLPCPMCGCCKYKLEILGIYDIKDKHQGVPINVTQGYVEIAKLKFKVACDENIRGYDLNICFEFDDEMCTENTFSDVSGYMLYVSDNPDFFNYDDCDTQFHGVNIVMNKLHFDLFAPPGTINPLGRPCGGVLVRTTAEKVVGDINLNLLPYEVADVVLFSSYFIYGTDVFIIDEPVQIANTDINRDGHPLSLTDFILMLRVILGDASAIPKPTPGSDLATIYVSQGKVSTNANLGAALLTFKGEGKVSSNLTFEQGVVDGNLRVLVYMNSGTGVTGELLTISGATLEKVEAVDNFGRPVKTTLVNKVIPTAFALHPNYPNPFNPETNISFALPEDSRVNLKIYNLSGQLVKTLLDTNLPAGTYTVNWDGTNGSEERVASGIYFYKLTAGNNSQTRKMCLMK